MAYAHSNFTYAISKDALTERRAVFLGSAIKVKSSMLVCLRCYSEPLKERGDTNSMPTWPGLETLHVDLKEPSEII